MRNWLMILATVGISLLLVFGITTAAESVRIVSNIDNITAGFNVHQNGSGGASLSLEVPAVAITPVTVNSREYQQVDLPGAERLFLTEPSAEGEPAVPTMTAMLAIPDQVGIELNVTYSGYDTFEDIDLAPVQPSPADNDPEAVLPFTQNMTTYTTDAFYPGELAVADEPVIMRDVRGVQIELRPVQYNPVRRELRVYRELAVSITYGGEPINPKLTRTQYLSDGFYPLYKSTFANFEEMFSTAEVKRGGYIIICKPTLADSLKALALWKHKKGYTVRIVKTTDIIPGGSPTYTQIFNYLRTAYQTWEVPPEYVMLAGDVNGAFPIPYYPYGSFASDHHYACVDGSDYLPDLFVARLTVDDMQQFRKAVAKIFKYEEQPLMRDPEHWIRGLSIGYTYYESSRLITLWVRHLMLENGFARVDTVYGQGRDQRVFSYLNSGPGLIQYRGAGGTDGWWGPECYIPDMNALQTTNKLGVMAILTCGTGDFGQECLGETWITMGVSPDSLKGGPGYYGVSDHFTSTRWNNPIMVGYYFGIFGDNIYHFAAAACRGKMQDYYAFPGHRNSEVQQYFHTYNMLGDPELEIRTKIPILLRVTHPETLAFGLNHIDINVVDTSGHPIRDAFVTLIKMVDTTEELYNLGKTDGSGNVSLSYNATTPGGMFLTVSGQNLYPYEDTLQIVTSDVAIGLSSMIIDDDNFGHSLGNSDSLANPKETLELRVTLANFGDSLPANNLMANLTSLDEDLAQVLDGSRSIGGLAPGENRIMDNPYIVQVSPAAQDGDLLRLKQTITDLDNQSWVSVIEIPVKAPRFVVSRVTIQDGNNRLDPGDTANVVLTVVNRGHAGASAVSGSIVTQDDYTTVRVADGSFGDIAAGDSSTNASSPMVVSVSAEAFSGRTVNFTLHTMTSSGAESDIPFHAKVDSVLQANDPTGPDAYGYYMYDKTDTLYEPHPHYNWVEIVPNLGGQGSRLNYGSGLDDKSVLVTLPFNLVYYGQSFGSIIVCINGFISPDTSRMDMAGNYWAYFYNWSIPDPGNCRAQISPFWDDLSFSGTTYGVYTWNDTTNHQFVIEWYHMVNNFNHSTIETFETIILDPVYHPTLTGDAEILYQYNTISNIDSDQNYSTVGLESWDELTGIQYTLENQYAPGSATLANSMAILITTNTGRGGIKGQVILEGSSDNSGAKISASSGQYRITDAIGNYWLRNLSPGQVNLKAELTGYFQASQDNVLIQADSLITDMNFNLTRCPIPASLEASDNVSYQIEIAWTPVSHPYCVGYNLYRSLWRDGEYVKLNENPVSTTSYIDQAFPDSGTYWYYVTAAYSQGSWIGESMASVKDAGHVTNPVGINDNQAPIPGSFFLSQNYPNPFNPTTTISYGLPKDGQVRVEIYNLLGQRIRVLRDGMEKAGFKSLIWDGMDMAGKAVSSGIYFYRIEAGSFKDSKKMLMLK